MQTVRTFRKLKGGRARKGRDTVLHGKFINTLGRLEDKAGGAYTTFLHMKHQGDGEMWSPGVRG